MHPKSPVKISFPHKPGAGGPGSFQRRFEEEAIKNGWDVLYSSSSQKPDVILIVGGTKKLFWLLKMKLKNVPIVLRLDGIIWLHRKKKVGFKNYISAEIINFIVKFLHAVMADKVIYQSQFVKRWWEKKGWKYHNDSSVIYNGIDTAHTESNQNNNKGEKRLVILEGVVDYTPYALKLLNDLAENLPETIKIEVYGKFENKALIKKLNTKINYVGFLDPSKVFGVFQNAVYLSLDINPACPNTVIEALSCGSPVVAFDTGALSELVTGKSGIVVPYGSNPWDLDYPDIKSLTSAIVKVFSNYDFYSLNAQKRALNFFNIGIMFDQYKDEILSLLKHKSTSAA